MAATLNPYLTFPGTAREAMTFYQSVLGGELTISTFGEYGGDGEQLRAYWTGLSEGAEIQMPLEKQMWGDEFGMLVDRYGIPWMINIAAAPQA